MRTFTLISNFEEKLEILGLQKLYPALAAILDLLSLKDIYNNNCGVYSIPGSEFPKQFDLSQSLKLKAFFCVLEIKIVNRIFQHLCDKWEL